MRRGAAAYLGSALLVLTGTSGSALAQTAAPVPDLAGEISFVLRNGIQSCWSPPAGVKGEVVVRIQLSRDMTVVGEPKMISPRPADPVLKASVIRAILRCSPYKGLRKYIGNYDLWRDVELRFDSTAP